MAPADSQRLGDVVFPPSTYGHILDTTKGQVSVWVGPTKVPLGDNDQLVVWQEGEWVETGRHEAIEQFVRAKEGQYIILHNPARTANDDGTPRFPSPGRSQEAVDLDHGRKIVIPGPVSFPLWPGQTADVLDGHHLRNNQYLIVRVYEPEQAKANAEAAIVARTGEGEEETKPKKGQHRQEGPIEYTMGKLMVIKGTDVSFYIPPTGIEVVADPDHKEEPYIRGAVTLQRLEYCILLDENGDKRYVKGPDVVFPAPTEHFQTDENNKRRFQAIQLNPVSALHLKVIEPYIDNTGHEWAEGEERFITGEQTPIYFPRPEETIVTYGEDSRKHHAIAIPKGEGRYVLDRNEGSVDLVTGPKMFLADPRHQMVIRRILDQDLCAVMYPGNEEALQANANFEEEGIALSNLLEQEKMRGVMSPPSAASTYLSVSSSPGATPDLLEQQQQAHYRARAAMQKQARSAEPSGIHRSAYRRPRTVVLDTKYEGAVRMSVYPGYAVLLVNSTGDRRVIEGPSTVLLEYDETPTVLRLSTGRPKTLDNPLSTCYLKTLNNQVSDRVVLETKDLVPVTIDLSYRVNFTGNPEKWFDLENYIKVLTDHCRSKLRNLAKRHEFQGFYDNTTDLIRDHLLGNVTEGEGRQGMTFDENGMHLFEIEVTSVRVNNSEIEKLTRTASFNAIEGAVRLSEAHTQSRQLAEREALNRTNLDERDKTKVREHQFTLDGLQRALEDRLTTLTNELKAEEEATAISALRRSEDALDADQNLSFEREQMKLRLEALAAEVEQYVKRSKALDKDVVTALQVFGDQRIAEHLLESVGAVAATMGLTAADFAERQFKGTALEPIMGAFTKRPYALATNGHDE